MDILIYKDGISNNSLKEFLNKKNILYDIDIKKAKYDYIIKPPSVLKEEVLSKVKGKVICDIEFIYWLYKPIIFSVTGTSGKTTTCLLLNNILKRKYDVCLAGNIGIPLGSVYEDNSKIYLLEMSSFELDSTLSFKPQIAVLLNIDEAHLDWHKKIENYIEAKSKIFKNQDEFDILIYNKDDKNILSIIEKTESIKKSISLYDDTADIYYNNGVIYTSNGNINVCNCFSSFEGDIYNMMASILVSLICDIDINIIKEELYKFKKPHFRMEEVKPNIYNDAKSTNILSTLTQIKKFKNVNLICGGYDRLNDLSDMKKLFPYVNKFFLYGQNKERVSAFLDKYNFNYIKCINLEDATNLTLKEEKIIIYSPMAPSYDEYESYEQRGEEFNRIIGNIKKHP